LIVCFVPITAFINNLSTGTSPVIRLAYSEKNQASQASNASS
jgi:hypothetical protein